MRVSVIIPALNEERSIGRVLDDIPQSGVPSGEPFAFEVAEVIVVDNGSTDGTAAVAAQHGARIVSEPRRGYGSACLAGIDALSETDIVAFIDADYSDYPEELPILLEPILADAADMVIGSRMILPASSDALMPQARFGNWLATQLIGLLTDASFTDLGPFRAIRRDTLAALDMRDRNYGWTVEMQMKAARRRFRCAEVTVRYRDRIGESKISGTLSGSVRAGWKILATIARYSFD